jgi:hypothetical protein
MKLATPDCLSQNTGYQERLSFSSDTKLQQHLSFLFTGEGWYETAHSEWLLIFKEKGSWVVLKWASDPRPFWEQMLQFQTNQNLSFFDGIIRAAML